jgi:hypothetical protein
MKTIKIARISSGVEEEAGQLYPNFTAVTKLDTFEWCLFEKTKKIYDKISFENFCHEDSAGVEKITKEEAEIRLIMLHEEGCNPHVYLFSFEIDEYVWKNKKRLAIESGYGDDVWDYINDITQYDWEMEDERQIDIPKQLIKMLSEFEWIQENKEKLQMKFMQFLIETGNPDDLELSEFERFMADGNRDIVDV